MVLNVLIDTLVGMVPVLGDLFDAAFQANVRNLDLLERMRARENATGALPGRGKRRFPRDARCGVAARGRPARRALAQHGMSSSYRNSTGAILDPRPRLPRHDRHQGLGRTGRSRKATLRPYRLTID